MKSLANSLKITVSIASAAQTADVTGTSVDLANYNSASVVFIPATITDGTHTPSVLDSDDNSTFTAVAAANLSATLAVLASDVVQKVDYMGTKRYIKPKVAVPDATTGGVYGAIIIRGNAHIKPVS